MMFWEKNIILSPLNIDWLKDIKLFVLKIIFYMEVYMCVFPWGQKSLLGTLELELQGVGNHLIRVLGSELGSSGRKSNVLTLIHLSKLIIKLIVKYTGIYLEKNHTVINALRLASHLNKHGKHFIIVFSDFLLTLFSNKLWMC